MLRYNKKSTGFVKKAVFYLLLYNIFFLFIFSKGNITFADELTILFPDRNNIEVGAENLTIIGRYYSENNSGLNLAVNNSPAQKVKLDKGGIFQQKVRLDKGVNEIKIAVSGDDSKTKTMKIFYGEGNGEKIKDYTKFFIHAPLIDNDCTDCHTLEVKDGFPSIDISKRFCFDCHEDFNKEKFIHGPIGEGTCACHNSHGSPEAKILRNNKRKICYFCHEEEAIKKDHLAKLSGTTDKEDCIYCHNPHNGKDKYFLKENKAKN